MNHVDWTRITAVSCMVEWVCWAIVAVALWRSGQRNPIRGLGWLVCYATFSSWGRLITAYNTMRVTPDPQPQALWHAITAVVGIGAARYLIAITRKRQSSTHVDNGMAVTMDALSAQDFVDECPFPAAVASTSDGGILAVNAAYEELMGASIVDIRGYNWSRFSPRERTRLLSNWSEYCLGMLPYYYEESTWQRPSDGKEMQISARGRRMSGRIVAEVRSIEHLKRLEVLQVALKKAPDLVLYRQQGLD